MVVCSSLNKQYTSGTMEQMGSYVCTIGIHLHISKLKGVDDLLMHPTSH